MYKALVCLLCLILPVLTKAQVNYQNHELLQLIQSFSETSAVTGREKGASEFVESLFSAGTLKKDKLGDLVLTIGSGSPRRLFTAPLDEPGYVISHIQENGYMRITPIGFGQFGNMYHQFLEGNEVNINTETGTSYGVAVVPSMHFEGLRAVPERTKNVYQWQETFIDAGLSSSKAVAEKGIQLLDPLTISKKPQIIGNEYITAPSAKPKAAVMALASVAKTLIQSKIKGTVVIAFTTLELINGKGIEDVVNKYGPFDEVVRFNRFLNGSIKEQSDILADKKLPFTVQNQSITTPVMSFRHPATNDPDWLNATVYNIGLPSDYTSTPVEMVSAASVDQLIQCWLNAVENRTWRTSPLKPTLKTQTEETYQTFQKENELVAKLVSLYGVSGAEKPVRDYILSALPNWAKPVTDAKGNIVLTFGKGKQHIAFVAHMDEVGYVVDSIRADGKLVLNQRGGFFNSVWEGHAALVHAGNKDIPAVFEPRSNYMTATVRMNRNISPTVFAGFKSKQQAVAAGIMEGITTVTMPKEMIRLSGNKATARGFDDRAGCASLLLALQNIKPDKLPFKVTFVWSVEEETSLVGSTFAAKNLQDVSLVYPIDTYVSSDDPVEPKNFADCPLGNGAVIRVLESINIVNREHLHYLQTLSAKNNIKTQYGMTAGGTDGQAFLKYDIPSVPISWPGRYSHSPIEIMDFRDLDNLVKLIQAIVTDGNKSYD